MLKFLSRPKEPKISIVVVFFNMRREAARTLLAFTTRYQREVNEGDYEVIVVDSNSSEPLDGGWVESLQDNFRYQFVDSDVPTPNRAMNWGIQAARGTLIMCLIDGARIPSPRVIAHSLKAQQAFGPCYAMTLGMHLGPKRQNLSVTDGYCQAVEDELLNSVDWQSDGYELFKVSAPAGSSRGGFFQAIAESNCFTVPKDILLETGGFDERFVESGGGLVNLHIHNQLIMRPELRPVLLLGETTFHQFHGGVSTNVPAAVSPFQRYAAEYQALMGKPFEKRWREPLYFGEMPQAAKRFLYIDV